MGTPRKAAIIAVAAAVIAAYSLGAYLQEQDGAAPRAAPAFHATLADPELYAEDGTYSEAVELGAGLYELGFVPNGDSPRTLTVRIAGEGVSFLESFTLESERHAGLSEYYTWSYAGEASVSVAAPGPATVTVDPHGDLLAPVSVTLAAARG